jgi:hypothetical protein
MAKTKHAGAFSPVFFLLALHILNRISGLLPHGMKALHDSLVGCDKALKGCYSSVFRHLAKRACTPESNVLARIAKPFQQ